LFFFLKDSTFAPLKNINFIKICIFMNTPEQTRKYWLYTGISTAVMCGLLVVYPEWFWTALPFVLTYLVKAFDAI
jgi:hypothetical protein